MRISPILLCIFVLSCTTSNAQFSKSVNDAFLITRMAEKFHFQPKPVNDSFSSNVYLRLLKELDRNKTFFTAEDIKTLSVFQFSIDDEVKNKKSAFLSLLTKIYSDRITK